MNIHHTVYPPFHFSNFTDWQRHIHLQLHSVSKKVALTEKGIRECDICMIEFSASFVRLASDIEYQDTNNICGYCSGEIEQPEQESSFTPWDMIDERHDEKSLNKSK